MFFDLPLLLGALTAVLSLFNTFLLLRPPHTPDPPHAAAPAPQSPAAARLQQGIENLLAYEAAPQSGQEVL